MTFTRLSALIKRHALCSFLLTFCSYYFLLDAGAKGTIDNFKNFDASQVSKVEVKIDPLSWERLCRQNRPIGQSFGKDLKNGYSFKPFSYFKADITINGNHFRDVGIRKKGFIGSLDGERPSLKVKLNHVHKDQTLNGVTHLTLNNCKQDAPIVNQFLAYTLFNKAGSPAPRAAFSNVVINGQNLGIYCHVESYKKPMVENAFGSDKGVLYEGTITDFYPEFEKSFDRKFGSKKTGLKAIRKLISIIHSEDTDETFLNNLKEVLDVNAFLKYWAIESLIGFWDGYSGNKNNFFFYLDPKDDKFRFMPWGADSVFTTRQGFGRRGSGPRIQFAKTNGIIAGKLYQIPEIRERYSVTMKKILEESWDSNWMLEETNRLEEMLQPYVHEAQGGFIEALENLREFITYRKENLLKEEADGLPDIPTRYSPPLIVTTIGKMEGQILLPIFDKHPGETDGLGNGKIEVSLHEENPDSVGQNFLAHKVDPEISQRGFGRGWFGRGGFGRGRGNPEDMLQIVLEVFYGDYPDQLTLDFSVNKKDLFIPDETPIIIQGTAQIGNEFSNEMESHSLSGVIKVSAVEEMDGKKNVKFSLDAHVLKRPEFGRF